MSKDWCWSWICSGTNVVTARRHLHSTERRLSMRRAPISASGTTSVPSVIRWGVWPTDPPYRTPFQCLSSPSALYTHKKTHGEKVFRCQFCTKTFTLKNYLKLHVRQVGAKVRKSESAKISGNGDKNKNCRCTSKRSGSTCASSVTRALRMQEASRYGRHTIDKYRKLISS